MEQNLKEELGLSSDEINEDLRSKTKDQHVASSGNIIQSDTINIDLSDKRKVLGIASALTMLIGAMCPVTHFLLWEALITLRMGEEME